KPPGASSTGPRHANQNRPFIALPPYRCPRLAVPSGHARKLSRSVQPWNRLVALTPDRAAPVGLDAAIVLAGQRVPLGVVHSMEGILSFHRGDLHGATIKYGRLLAEHLEAVAGGFHHKDPVLII